MRLSRILIAVLVLSALLPAIVSAQLFPPNADLSRSISLLTAGMQVQAMAVDSTGNVYLAGTTSVGLTGATTTLGPRGDTDLFVIKTNSAGDQVLYSTVIGGSFGELLKGMRVDANGNVHILGSTDSLNFPFDSLAVPTNPTGTFVLKLNATGTAITYARQLGVTITATSMDLDASGAVYLGGFALAGDLATTAGVIKPTHGTSAGDPIGFIAKLATNGQSFAVATYFGPAFKGVEQIHVRSNGVFVLGNGTLSVLNAALSAQTASAAINATPARFAFDNDGNVYLSGTTSEGFVLRKYSGSNLSLQFEKKQLDLTLVSENDPPRIAVSSNGRIFLFGRPIAPNFQTMNATQPCLANIAMPNGLAGHPGLSSDGGLVGALGSIPPDQALMILDASGNVLHSTFTTSIVSNVAVAPNGRIYASTVQNQFSSGPTTQWRGIVRYNQDTIPAAANAPSCIVLAAGSYQVAALSPGAFMAIYGNGMGPVQGVVLSQLTPEGLVSPLLGGVRVTVDNKPAALHYVQDKQVNFITPWGIPTDGTAVPVCVIFNGATTCVQASTTVAVPGAFPCDVGTGLSCAAHPGGSVNWPVSTTIGGREFRPAKPGESIEIYMTGFGKVGGTLVDGGVFTSGSRPLLGTLTASTEPPPTGGCGIFACEPAVAAAMTVNVEYAGAAGGAVLGVDQVNLKIPAEIPDGFHTFRLSFVPQGADPNKPIVIPVKMHVKK